MSVNLTYLSAAVVPEAVKARIKEAAAKLNESPTWWCEGMHFFEAAGYEGRLVGSTKMFFSGGYHDAADEYVEVDADDDAFTAAHDARRIVEHLSGWSQEPALAWDLRCAGEAVGHIANGMPDDKLLAFLKDWRRRPRSAGPTLKWAPKQATDSLASSTRSMHRGGHNLPESRCNGCQAAPT
jgi:hypothetical protein